MGEYEILSSETVDKYVVEVARCVETRGDREQTSYPYRIGFDGFEGRRQWVGGGEGWSGSWDSAERAHDVALDEAGRKVEAARIERALDEQYAAQERREAFDDWYFSDRG